MKIMSNIPEVPMMMTTDYIIFKIGDRVRVQFVAKNPEYPYIGGGVIGIIKAINHDNFVVDFVLDERVIAFDDVYIIKKVGEAETFDSDPNINAEDLKMLEWLNKKYYR